MSDLTPVSIREQFQEAIEDLWWMSETDAPFELTLLNEAFPKGFSLPELIRLTEHDPELPSEEVSIDKFFARAIKEEDWHGDLEKEDVRRFRHLKALILDNLEDTHIIRFGTVNQFLYILGKQQEGDWLMLSTQAVET